MKKLLSILLVGCLLCSAFAACAANGSVAPSSAPQTATGSGVIDTASAAEEALSLDGVELTMWYMPIYSGFDERINNSLVPEVKEKYGITLNTEVLTYDAGPEKITVAMATGATPDIFLDGYTRIAPALKGNLSVPLTDLANELAPMMYDNVLDQGMVGTDYYYIPINVSTGYNLCVNTTLAKQLGVYDLLPEDKIHWSYDEFLEFARACVEKGKKQNIYATQLFAGSKSSDSVYYSFLMSGGSQILSDDHSSVAANMPQAAKTLGLFKTMIDEKLVPAGAATTIDNDIRGNWYSQKLVAMYVTTGISEISSVKKLIDSGEIEPFDVDIYEIPTPDGKADPKVASWGSTGFTVFRNSEDAQKIAAAKKVIQTYLENEEYNQEMCKQTGNSTVLKALEVNYDDPMMKEQAKRAAQSTAKYSSASFGILEPWWSDFRETFYVQLQAYFTGEKTVEQALSDWETTGNVAIQKALAQTK